MATYKKMVANISSATFLNNIYNTSVYTTLYQFLSLSAFVQSPAHLIGNFYPSPLGQ